MSKRVGTTVSGRAVTAAHMAVHKLRQAAIEKHADVLDKHRQKGPLFAAAVDALRERHK